LANQTIFIFLRILKTLRIIDTPKTVSIHRLLEMAHTTVARLGTRQLAQLIQSDNDKDRTAQQRVVAHRLESRPLSVNGVFAVAGTLRPTTNLIGRHCKKGTALTVDKRNMETRTNGGSHTGRVLNSNVLVVSKLRHCRKMGGRIL
jgi:hypothetical protein